MGKLGAREKRLLEYLAKCKDEGRRPKIGDICKDCNTTPWTLLRKTWPRLRMYLEDL